MNSDRVPLDGEVRKINDSDHKPTMWKIDWSEFPPFECEVDDGEE